VEGGSIEGGGKKHNREGLMVRDKGPFQIPRCIGSYGRLRTIGTGDLPSGEKNFLKGNFKRGEG